MNSKIPISGAAFHGDYCCILEYHEQIVICA